MNRRMRTACPVMWTFYYPHLSHRITVGGLVEAASFWMNGGQRPRLQHGGKDVGNRKVVWGGPGDSKPPVT